MFETTVSNKNVRINISNTLRFRILERDQFRCRYCHRMQPEIPLEVDHVHPVSRGGTNDTSNLATSCYDCNRGKGARVLRDKDFMLKEQSEEIKALKEERDNMQVILDIQESLAKLNKEALGEIRSYINDRIKPLELTEIADQYLQPLLKKYKIDDIFDAIDISIKAYILKSEESIPTEENVSIAMSKIPGILHNRSLGPVDQKLLQIKQKLSQSFGYFNISVGNKLLRKYARLMQSTIVCTDEKLIDWIENNLYQEWKEIKNWTEWREKIDREIKLLEISSCGDA